MPTFGFVLYKHVQILPNKKPQWKRGWLSWAELSHIYLWPRLEVFKNITEL